jgi:sigma-B regulation protein RsbU (phosphoserine phosphatase)
MADPDPLEAVDIEGAFALLADMSQEFAAGGDLAEALERALGSIARHVGSEAGSLWLIGNDRLEAICSACVGPNSITGVRLAVTEGIIGKSVRENACQMVIDAVNDPHFSTKIDDESGFLTRSILCAPMRVKGEAIGAIELINKRGGDGKFAQRDAHLLQVLASSAGLAIANAKLAAAQIENERVRRELELAAEIQRNLLPAPRPAPFPLSGINVPARTVSGDFFDILPLEDGRIHFCLGDVSGKGMNAALLMAKTASLYRCLARDATRPSLLLERLNDEVCETATYGMFVTLAAGLYDPSSGRVCLANAGHEPPLCHGADRRFTDFEAQAPPLGIVPGTVFPEQEIALEGGSLYLCSDGLTEAGTGAGQALGSSGLRRLVERLAGKPLSERVDAIVSEVSGLDLRDDLTLLAVSDEAAASERAAGEAGGS